MVVLRAVVPGLTATLLACALGAMPARAGEEADVRVTIVRVNATGELAADAEPVIDPKLRRHASKLRDLRYARYERGEVARKSLAWGETLVAGSGKARIRVTPTEPEEPGRVPLAVAIGEGRSCLKSKMRLRPGKAAPVFCDGLLEDGTVVYFISVDSP